MLEVQIGQQTHLIALRTLRRIALDERERQSLFEEAQLIDVTTQPFACVDSGYLPVCLFLTIEGRSDKRMTAANTTQTVRWESYAQCLVDIDVGLSV